MLNLQRSAGNRSVSSVFDHRDGDESLVGKTLRGDGSPLDAVTRLDMEARLGHDFGDVRLHTDAQAGASAQSVQAHAYTVGNHVVFGAGNYQPTTDQGKRTLAHELTHVVQQRNGPVDGTPAAGGISVSHPSDRFEQEAERTADAAMSAPAGNAAGDSVQGLFVQREGSPEEEAEEPAVQQLDVKVQREDAPEEEEEPAAG